MSNMVNKSNWLNKIPPSIGYYIAGFTDGEGSFNVSMRKGDGYRYGWQFCFSFCVSQKDEVILSLLKRYLNCGRMKQRRDGLWYYAVENQNSLFERIIPFFNKFGFLSARTKKNFSVFKRILAIVQTGEHIKPEGIKDIVHLREELNEGRGRKRKYNQSDVCLDQESSETIC